jgi:signal recognition particle subunit SRP54
MFASTGEKLADFDVFHPDRMASRILGMGDVLTLIEQAQTAFDDDQQQRMTEKLMGGGGDFTLEDFLEQMLSVQKMGPIANVLGMLPGAGQMKEQLAQIDDSHLDRVAAIIRSMTPAERDDPKIINGSRRLRIANGSGVAVSDVNQLVDRFFEARKMMKQMGGQMGLPGARRSATRSSKNKRKGKKGGGGGQRRMPLGGGMPGGLPGGMPGAQGQGAPPALPPGLGGLPGGMPKIDFSKLNKPDK